MKNIFGQIKKLFRKKRIHIIEPLVHSNVERLFEEWSRGFGISIQPSNLSLCAADVKGNYAVRGKTPNTAGDGYFGTLRLEPKGSLLKAYWEIGHTRQPQHGYGFVKDDLVALDFYYTEEGQRFYGRVIYRVVGDKLAGFWRENHTEEIALEEATLKNRL